MKLNFIKAYCKISWDFLFHVMENLRWWVLAFLSLGHKSGTWKAWGALVTCGTRTNGKFSHGLQYKTSLNLQNKEKCIWEKIVDDLPHFWIVEMKNLNNQTQQNKWVDIYGEGHTYPMVVVCTTKCYNVWMLGKFILFSHSLWDSSVWSEATIKKLWTHVGKS